MKIEIGESLLQSFLKYEKDCLITQTNWKSSNSWEILDGCKDSLKEVFKKIQKHPDFSSVFKGVSLDQALKQAELDVIGINNDKLYMVEVAFHENGLQYGNKSETKDRVCKKLLRAYLIGLAYFPNFTYEIIFASPKVNPATDKIIKDYFSTLEKDFGDAQSVHFSYIASDAFKTDILIPTLKASQFDSDTSELFLRSSKLLEIFKMINTNANKNVNATKVKKTSEKDSILKNLHSLGMKVFIEYYDYFKNPSYSVGDIKEIMKKNGYKPNSSATKASSGRKIVKEGHTKEALEIIANAGNIDDEIIENAKKLLKDYK